MHLQEIGLVTTYMCIAMIYDLAYSDVTVPITFVVLWRMEYYTGGLAVRIYNMMYYG